MPRKCTNLHNAPSSPSGTNSIFGAIPSQNVHNCASNTCKDPVTVPAAPQNASFMDGHGNSISYQLSGSLGFRVRVKQRATMVIARSREPRTPRWVG